MRLKIDIPKPSAKRLETNRILKIKFCCCWEHRVIKNLQIPVGVKTFEFDFDGPIEHRDPDVLDADYYHQFVVSFQNSTGSRFEEINVTPEEIVKEQNG